MTHTPCANRLHGPCSLIEALYLWRHPGMMLALQCAPRGARVHLFGFNWSRKHWQAHRMASEERFARAMHASGRIFIHWPVCDGLRNCNHCADALRTGKHVKGCYGITASSTGTPAGQAHKPSG